MTKTLRLIIVSLVSLAAVALLSACSGAGVYNSWPGVTVSEDGTTAYVSNNTHIYSVDIISGTEKWRFPQKANNSTTFFAPVAIGANGQLVAGSYDKLVYGINPAGATQIWTFAGSTNRYIGGPLSTGDLILAPSSDGNLYALDQNGAQQWVFDSGTELWSTPVVDGNVIYQASMDHHVYALQRSTGTQIWKSDDLGGASGGSPRLGPDGKLYVGTFKPELVALDTKTGSTVWTVAAQGWVWSPPLLKDGVLYYGSLAGEVFAVDASSGKTLWRIQPVVGANSAVTGTPVIIDKTLYFGSQAGILYAVDSATGAPSNVFKDPSTNAPASSKQLQGQIQADLQLVGGNTILVAPTATQAILVALDPSGNQKWAFIPAK